jgi:tetratricopeptide (TPR) repeat protein
MGQDFCNRCGTRLMIVVEPSSARYELTDQSIPTDEHLLERISVVENRLTRLTERLERSLDLLLRQAQNSYFDRSLIKALIAILTEDGFVETDRLERLWNDRCENDSIEQKESSHRAELRVKILSDPPSSNPTVFADLVGEGFTLLEEQQTAVGIDKLQRAADMTESNSALNLFIGEHFFRSGNPQVARSYLSKVYEATPDDFRVELLLGLACADDGDADRAKKLLERAIKRGGPCFAGHYGLGWLYMVESNWRKALTQFKRALAVRPSPEAHYVLASLYYKLDRDELAGRHLRKAVEMDRNYSEAFYLLALVYKRTGQEQLAAEALERATPKSTTSPKSGKPQKNRTKKPEPFITDRARPSGLILGADRRLAAALKDDALQAFHRLRPQRH